MAEKSMVSKVAPFLAWFSGYGRAQVKADALAGLTVALVLIPQSMAYAQLAGLPVYYGLYASFLPPMVAAMFGSSRQLATGPVAVVSLMTAAALEPLATAGSQGYISYAIALSVIVGAFQFSLGLLRLGLVVNFISHPVVLGFTNAAAIIIATSQFPKIFGVDVEKGDQHYETVLAVFKDALYFTHWPTLLMGAAAFILMIALKKFRPKIPAIVLVVIAASLISWAADFEKEATVRLGDVESIEVRTDLVTYNNFLDTLKSLNNDRTLARRTLDDAPEHGLTRLNAQRDLDAIEYLVQITRLEVQEYRQRLRRHLLRAAANDDGRLAYYPVGRVPEGLAAKQGVWRIAVGSGPVNTESILLFSGGKVVGHVPDGLPALKIPRIDLDLIRQLLPYALIIAIIGFMEAVSIAKAMAARTGQRLDPNEELIGQGLGNVIGAFGQSYPTSGSFSRSAVNLEAGAVTGMSSVFTSLIVAAALLFFTPLLYHLPQSVLAAIIMVAVVGLINFSGIAHAWRAQWYEGVIAVITFAATLYYAPHLDKGILLGVVISLLVFLYKSMRPKIVSLSRGEDQALHASLIHGLRECRYIDMIRFDGPLFFASADYLEEEIIRHLETKPELKHIIIEASAISMMDASGEIALRHIIHLARGAGIDISFSDVHQDVLDVMARTGLIKEIGVENIFPQMEEALNSAFHRTHKDSWEKLCPLKTVVYNRSIHE